MSEPQHDVMMLFGAVTKKVQALDDARQALEDSREELKRIASVIAEERKACRDLVVEIPRRASSALEEVGEKVRRTLDARAWRLPLILAGLVVIFTAALGYLGWQVSEKVAERANLNKALAEKFGEQLRVLAALENSGASLACDVRECVVTLSGKIQATKTDGKVRIVLPPIAQKDR